MYFLRIIRIQNLVIIALTQLSIRFFLFEKFDVILALNDFEYILLVLSTVCIAAGGNIINDIYDVETDLVNKPHKTIIGNNISEKVALYTYFILNFIGVGIGFFLSNKIGKPSFAGIFILISALLYFYANYLKRSFLLGNILVSLLTSMVFLITGVFDLLPELHFFNLENRQAFRILFHFSVFAFFINLLREMVKDQEDINGDYKAGMQTLPIVLGRDRTNHVISYLTSIPALGIILYMYHFLIQNDYAILYSLFLILVPLLVFMVKIHEADSIKTYRNLSRLLKILMLIGILGIAFYPWS